MNAISQQIKILRIAIRGIMINEENVLRGGEQSAGGWVPSESAGALGDKRAAAALATVSLFRSLTSGPGWSPVCCFAGGGWISGWMSRLFESQCHFTGR